MQVGALEARRWAGLVFAAGPDDGVGLRLAFVTPQGERRELDDWYRMVSRVGPHAPDGSYARVEFDVGVKPSARAAPAARTLVLEWSRQGGAAVLHATLKAPGRLEVIGDAPWDWEGRWRAGGAEAVWRARLKGAEITAVFAAGTEACEAPGAGRGEIARVLEVGDGEAGRVAVAAAWGGEDPEGRATRLAGGATDRIEAARVGWGDDRPLSAARPELVESVADNLMWTVLLQPETGRLYAPAGRRWIFPKPRSSNASASGGGRRADDWTVFGWDSFFNAILLATASAELAWSALLAGVESRYPNGNVPNWRSRRAGTPDRSHPPVGSFAALKLHRRHPDTDALASAYPGLLAWSDWWVAEKGGRPRREGITPGLLAWGSDTDLLPAPDQVPPWEKRASGRQRAAWESGQDDLPLWDEAEWDPELQVLAMSAVDLCSYRALDLECLSRIARILGDRPTADRLADDYRRLAATVDRALWSETAGLYLDELPSGHSTRVAASNFLPLAAGIPSRARARRTVKTLSDPGRFWGERILPTVPRDDPAFADQRYWRGSIWPPMNYLVLQGLRRYGFTGLADDLARKGAEMFLADRRRTGMCREHFDARTGRGLGRRFQSWSPLLALGALETDSEEPFARGRGPHC